MKKPIFFLLLLLNVAACGKTSNPELMQNSQERSKVEKVKNAELLIDVRSVEEYNSGHLDGAINIPHDQIQTKLNEIGKYKDGSVVLYCKSGRRAGIAQEVLKNNGFTNVVNAGGYSELVGK